MMRRGAQFLFALAMLSNGIAHAVAREPPSPSSATLPSDVTAFVERRAGCHHWAGEEPYDAARGRQIAAAIRRSRCDRLDADEKILRKRYRLSLEVGSALDKARDDDR